MKVIGAQLTKVSRQIDGYIQGISKISFGISLLRQQFAMQSGAEQSKH
jgi:hypothetical protein